MRPAALRCLLVFALGAAGCGEWSGAPVKTAEPGAVPLGPGPTLTVARAGGAPGPPAIGSWGATVAIAWAEPAAGGAGAAIKASTSQDAGATFAAPVVVGELPVPPDRGLVSIDTQVGVAAPVQGGRAGPPQVWVRAGPGSRDRSRAWHSRDGGRSFAELGPREAPPET
nr:hypothetical protein [Vicinamibacterales bacterium]